MPDVADLPPVDLVEVDPDLNDPMAEAPHCPAEDDEDGA